MRLAISRCGWLSSLLVAPKSSVCLTSCLADRQPVFTSREWFTKLVCRVLGAFAESSITCSVKISRGYALCFQRINFWYLIFFLCIPPFLANVVLLYIFFDPPKCCSSFLYTYFQYTSVVQRVRETARKPCFGRLSRFAVLPYSLSASQCETIIALSHIIPA